MDTPRYVDINKIHARLPVLKDNGDYLLSTSDVNMAIRLALVETEDVVEVVRCKDCRNRHNEGCPLMVWDVGIGKLVGETGDDDFCSAGEKRTDKEV